MFRPLAPSAVKQKSTMTSRANSSSRAPSIPARGRGAVVAGMHSTACLAAAPAPSVTTTTSDGRRVPIHLRGVKPKTSPPPHPLEGDIAAEEAVLDAVRRDVSHASSAALQCYNNILSAIDGHEVQLKSDKRMREEQTDENKAKIARAEHRLTEATERCKLEQTRNAEVQARLVEAQASLSHIQTQRAAIAQCIDECATKITQLGRDTATAAQSCDALHVELRVCKQKKLDHINSLDQVREKVRIDQEEERRALVELQHRKATIDALNRKIDAIRAGGKGGASRQLRR